MQNRLRTSPLGRCIFIPIDLTDFMMAHETVFVRVIMESEPVPLFRRVLPSYMKADDIFAAFPIVDMEYLLTCTG